MRLLLFTVILLVSCNNAGNLQKASQAPGQTRILNLSSSRLTTFPPEIENMKNLQEINLFRNEIDSVPDFIA